MFYLSRRKFKLYQRRKQSTGCPFCDPAEIDYRVQAESKHAYVILNQTFYDVWENHRVLDHLLVIPKRHIGTLGELADDELLDVTRLIAGYEAQGYSAYLRANNSPRRSVTHQHTHLIKIAKKQPKFSLYLHKPYLLINF